MRDAHHAIAPSDLGVRINIQNDECGNKSHEQPISIGGMGNPQLFAGLSELARQSSELSAQLLAHLVELEERLLHLELGF